MTRPTASRQHRSRSVYSNQRKRPIAARLNANDRSGRKLRYCSHCKTRGAGFQVVNAETLTKKICLIGDFGVGKTSVVARFVDHTFSDKYLSTFGVTIKTKTIEQGPAVKLVIWDIAGNDIVTATSSKYLRGADGFLLVVDGTRPVTALTAMRLREEVRRACGDIPAVCLMNKFDLGDEWRLSDSHEYGLRAGCTSAYNTSAKTGENVDQSFLDLAQAMCA